VLQITAAGIATGVPGIAHLVASVGGRTWGQWVEVLPRGTYRLAGRVVEAGLGIAGAAVTAIAGPAAGLSATTPSDNGDYALYGVVGDMQVRASKSGTNLKSNTLCSVSIRRWISSSHPSSGRTSRASTSNDYGRRMHPSITSL
jgi:hypothetical protein